MLKGINGFANGSLQDVEALNKALEAGYATSPDTQTGGGALRIESLEQTMHSLTFSENHIVLWKDIAKLPARSTVEEYNILAGYGNAPGFIAETDRPLDSVGDYERRYALVKFVGTTREISIISQQVGNITDPLLLETKSALRKMLADIEVALFWGLSEGAAGAEYVEWDGLVYQADPNNVIDARGKDFTKELIDNAAELITEGFGIPDKMYLSYKAFNKFRRNYDNYERILLPGTKEDLAAGYGFQKILAVTGPIVFRPSVLMYNNAIPYNFALGKKKPPTGATSASAPAAPTVSAAVNADGTGKFTEGAGDYEYVVTLVNKYGESAPSAAVTASLLNTTDSVTLTITNGASGEKPEQALIYRSKLGGGDKFLVARIPLTTGALGGTTTWKDTADILADTEMVVIVDSNPETLAFKSLTDTMRIELARLGPTIPFMFLKAGVPILYAPKKIAIIKNLSV